MAWTTPRTWTDGEVPTAAIFNTHVRDNIAWHHSGDGAWTSPAIGGGWSAYDATNWPVRYCHIGPFVRVEGLIAGGASGSTVFTLPATYRPGNDLIWCPSDSGAGAPNAGYSELRINTDGTVVAYLVSNNAWFCLGATFVAEA